jgi:hypothetical protein
MHKNILINENKNLSNIAVLNPPQYINYDGVIIFKIGKTRASRRG